MVAEAALQHLPVLRWPLPGMCPLCPILQPRVASSLPAATARCVSPLSHPAATARGLNCQAERYPHPLNF